MRIIIHDYMKEEKDAKKDIGTETEKKINTSAFMRQIAVAGINEEKPTTVHTDKQADEQVIEFETKARESAKKKKQSVTDYESVFLTRNELQNRQGLYIDKENYDTLQSLVNVIRRKSKLSVSGLVDNIIRHHIELYEEDINRIFDENIRKPITKK
ncbi:hypothetical protein GGR21_000648 [Dysgonomonas hofstadii]|uniref:DUF3408 domain-containing protein n=1 Tax=Dysgonomonas hofstadii TaxID=637886 RepID=A0A840CHS1_9BACT|nr:DUF3408 domain-containing protein [Dysgonomonas hofstadii]MBB4034761.1 hypothetical protein [Dysgonomonas hofstadii]